MNDDTVVLVIKFSIAIIAILALLGLLLSAARDAFSVDPDYDNATTKLLVLALGCYVLWSCATENQNNSNSKPAAIQVEDPPPLLAK